MTIMTIEQYFYCLFILIIFIIIIIYFIYKYIYYRYSNIYEIYTNKNNIPKIIIQTWKNKKIPYKYKGLVNILKNYNPDFKYIFFDDNDISIFLKKNYPRYYITYKNLPLVIQKIDFFRYIIIYHYGGFYLDMDMLCKKSFSNLLNYHCIFPTDLILSKKLCKINRYIPYCQHRIKYLLGQYMFAAEPKNKFIKLLVDGIHNNIISIKYKYDNHNKNRKINNYVYKTTGPDYVTDIYIKYNNKRNIKILQGSQKFGNYATHLAHGSWK